MNRYLLYITFVILCFGVQAVAGQGLVETNPLVRAWTPPDAPEPTRWEVTLNGGYTWGGRATAYGSSRLNVAYRTPQAYAEGVVNLNQRQNFTFLPGRFILEVSDDLVGFTDSTRFEAPAETYDLNEPVGLHVGYQRQRWQIAGLVSALVQRARLHQPDVQESQPGLFFVNWLTATPRRTTVSGSVVGTVYLGSLALRGGLLTVPLVHTGDDAFKYAYRMQARPYGSLAWDFGAGQLDAGADARRLTAAYGHTLRLRLFGWRPLMATVRYQRGLPSYAYHAIRAQVTLPLTASVEGLLGFERTWTDAVMADQADFARWQHTSVLGQLEPLDNSLPHQRFTFGVRIRLKRKAAPWPFRLVQVRLLQEHIYSAKQGFYANNPIGFVEVFNEHEAPVAAQIVVETTDRRGTYRSARFTLGPDEVREVPIYLYLNPDHPNVTVTSSEQLVVSALVGERAHVLTSLPVTLYGKNAWDGSVWGLQYFVAPDDPVIKRRARQLFLGTRPYGTSTPTPPQKMAHLRAFLDGLGQNLQYIPDPTRARRVDQVQYPIETLGQGGGDCEDLAVLVASNLMSVGIQTAVVDIRPRPVEAGGTPVPRPGEPGHVFLLVDTGLPAEALAELGLNDFQGIVRQNANGAHTIWLPIEPTVLSEGFEAAFRDGVRLYYREVIQRNGVVTGDVQVYDF